MNIPFEELAGLQDKIAARKLQAMERGIFGKGEKAAVYLGSGGLNEPDSSRGLRTNRIYATSFWLLSESKALRIVYRSSTGDKSGTYSTLDIIVDGDTVFSQHGTDIKGYRPGAWEAELNRIQQAAAEAKVIVDDKAKADALAKQESAEAARRHAWGLDNAA